MMLQRYFQLALALMICWLVVVVMKVATIP